MFGVAWPRKPRKDDGEKPFWISFSDLMTGLMVLFLISMAISLLAVTRGVKKIEDEKKLRQDTIASCMSDVRKLTKERDFQNIQIIDHTIKFGSLAEFEFGKNTMSSDKAVFLRHFMPKVIQVAREKSCDKWLKQIVVEGFASQEGSYLYNLNLSFQRAQRVLCVLLDTRGKDPMSADDRRTVRKMFMTSGSSFNAAKKSASDSRRVELTMEFREFDSRKIELPNLPWDEDDRCPSDYS